MPLSLLIVAGEASGDAHAASLVRALRNAAPETQIEFFGSTGAQIREAGVESTVKADELAVLGLWDVGRALPTFWRAFGELKRAAEKRKPVAAILVDWPDFNLRLARWLHRRGIPVIYYISPQLWAWRSYRARTIQRDVDLLLSILPFEKDWYAARAHSSSSIDSLRIIHHQTREALAACDAAAIASGTATLEAALLATPMVIVYKESAVNWHALGSLITTEHFGLVNLIAGRRLA